MNSEDSSDVPAVGAGSSPAVAAMGAMGAMFPGFGVDVADALHALRVDADEAVISAGQTLVAERDVDGGPIVLVAGWAVRQRRMTDGRRQVLGFLLPGDFAALGSIAGEPSGHEVQALTEVRAWRLRRDALSAAASGRPEHLALLAVMAARQSALTDQHVAILGAQVATRRLATLLLMLHDRVRRLQPHADAGAGVPPKAEGGIDFPLTQEHLAAATGLSRVHTQRVLAQLQRSGIWRLGQRRLELLDRERALRLADWADDDGAAR